MGLSKEIDKQVCISAEAPTKYTRDSKPPHAAALGGQSTPKPGPYFGLQPVRESKPCDARCVAQAQTMMITLHIRQH